MRLLLPLAAIATLTVGSAALAQDDRNITFDGRIGQANVRMVLRVRGKASLVGGHYAYTRYRRDILLTGRVAGDMVELRETGAPRFSLHFETGDRLANRPLGFDTATALVGSWTGNGRTLPVRLALEGSGAVQAAGQYSQVTDAPDAAFERIAATFVDGVRTGDRAAAAGAVSYPLRVNMGASQLVRSKAKFVRL